MSSANPAADAKAPASRFDWVDVVKGVGITLVVLGHAVRGVHEAGLMPAELFHSIDARIYAFHMPLFFFVSGFFLAKSLAKASTADFLRTRFTQMLYPMVLWTYLFLLFKFLAGSFSNNPIGLDGVLVSPIPGQLHFWFLWALILIQLLALTIARLTPLALREHWTLLAFVLSLGLYFLHAPSDVAFYTGQAQKHAIYVFAGTLLFPVLQRLQLSNTHAGLAGLVFAAGLVLTPKFQAAGIPGPIIAALLTLSLVILLRRAGGRAWRLVIELGVASLAIYVSHTIFSAGFREVALRLGVSDLTAHLLIGTVVGLLLPLALYRVARAWGLAGWVGWR